MNNFLRFFKCAAFDALIVYAFYAWKIQGSEGASNVVLFWFWFVAIVGCMIGFCGASGTMKPRVKWIDKYNIVGDCCYIAAFVFYGHFAIAIFLTLGEAGAWHYRSKFDDEGLPKEVPA